MNTFAILAPNRVGLDSSGEGHPSVMPMPSQGVTSPGSTQGIAPDVAAPLHMAEREIVSGSTQLKPLT